jgi:hypothetical protein
VLDQAEEKKVFLKLYGFDFQEKFAVEGVIRLVLRSLDHD